jgi:hypothetical protein
MRTEGAATIQFDVGSGKAKIHNARIVADNLEAKGLDTAKNVSISGITLVSPDLTLGNLIVSITEGKGLIQGKDLRFATAEVTSDGPPYWNVKLGPGKELYVPKFDAHLGDTDKDLEIEDNTILETAARAGIAFRQAHGVINAEQAFYLVSQRAGVAILPGPSTVKAPAGGIVVRTLSDPALSLETCLIMRRDDDSKLVNQFARAFLKKYVRKPGPGRQMELPLTA